MRTFVFITLLALTAFVAQGQNDYEIEQRIDGRIEKMQINRGWQVNLVHDTVNAIVIHTPCEYYFAEGNEPNVCRLMPDGTLAVWQNRTMPQGTRLDIHYREPFEHLYLHPKATVSSDRLLIRDTNLKNRYGDIDVKRGATLRVRSLRCNGFLSIAADTAATVRIDTVHAGHLMLWSWQEATLTLDSIDAREVDYRRDPLAHGTLWTSNPARNIKVSTRNRWFMKGLKQLDNTLNFTFNTPFVQHYNNPYVSTYDISVIVGLKTNVIPMSQRLGLSLGIDFGMPFKGLMNNVAPNGRTLALDTVSPGVNRMHNLMYWYLGLPVKLHYLPKGKFAKESFNDLHIGLEPRWNFHQRYISEQYTSSQYRPNRQWEWDPGMKASIYNSLQVRAEIGCRINPFSNIEFNFFVDLLPTYRRETGMGKTHAFGFQIRF